jgi:hypothetical protein
MTAGASIGCENRILAIYAEELRPGDSIHYVDNVTA